MYTLECVTVDRTIFCTRDEIYVLEYFQTLVQCMVSSYP